MKKRLDSKYRVNFKIYKVSIWLKTITIHILPNISQSRDNQTMKFDQLRGYDKNNIFLPKKHL